MMNSPELLHAAHNTTLFDCGKASLNEWLQQHAMQAQGSGSAKTYIVTQASKETVQVVGYYSLTTGQAMPNEVTERIRKGMGQYPIPMVLLARLAVCRTAQGTGLGKRLLRNAIHRTLVVAEQIGIRALMTHPIDDEAAQFYKRFGFEASPLSEGQLMMLLKDARRVVG
jgi:GNAT superfamily N-acetyltransferase